MKGRMMGKLTALLAVGALTLVPAVASWAADPYPAKPVRIVVPFPPGGPADVLARNVADRLAAAFGQSVVVENRPGAAGNIGMELVAKSAPDGYTLALAPAGNLTVNPSLYRDVPYDVARDFAPVTVIAAVPNILVVNPGLPVQSVQDLIRYAKANPGKLNFSSPGSGSGAHLAGELFKSSAGVDIVHVPYSGIAPAVTAVVAGDVQLMFAGAPSALPQVTGGKLRALGVASPKRIAAAPALPTLDEAGLPGFDVTSWYSIVAPAGTPPATIDRLQREIARALDTPEMRAKLAALGAEPVANTPAEFAAMIRSETAKWSRIVKDAGIKPE
jgi:tripartite-type tricarboxylate transporter receptor subunit TctC